jgi:hypothetical protein
VAKLIDVRLEACDANPDGVAFYAYFEGEPSEEDLDRAHGTCSEVPGPLGPADWEEPEDRKEAPNALSEHAGLRRWYVSAAC